MLSRSNVRSRAVSFSSRCGGEGPLFIEGSAMSLEKGTQRTVVVEAEGHVPPRLHEARPPRPDPSSAGRGNATRPRPRGACIRFVAQLPAALRSPLRAQGTRGLSLFVPTQPALTLRGPIPSCVWPPLLPPTLSLL